MKRPNFNPKTQEGKHLISLNVLLFSSSLSKIKLIKKNKINKNN